MAEVSPVAGGASATLLAFLRNSLAGGCPRCGSKTLFAGWVKFADRCRACGLDFSSFNVGDGPAAFLILVIGAILTVGALVVDGMFAPPWWVHIVWLPIGLAMTIFGLRWTKTLLIGQEYRHRAREGRIVG